MAKMSPDDSKRFVQKNFDDAVSFVKEGAVATRK
jgi:hypothetical protein